MLFLLAAMLPVEGHHFCAQRCQDVQILSIKMPQELQDEA
jgi:hypothetical protein